MGLRKSEDQQVLRQSQVESNPETNKIVYINTPYPHTHSFYSELIENPPDGFDYIFPSQNQMFSNLSISTQILSRLSGLRLFDNTTREDSNLKHMCFSVLREKIPWILDFESIDALCKFHPKKIYNPLTRSLVRRSLNSSECKKILPWSKTAAQSLQNLALTDSKKVEVVYPAINPLRKNPKAPSTDEIRILYIGRLFYSKGGLETLMAFKELRQKFPNVRIDLVTHLPQEITLPDGARSFPLIPRDKLLNEVFPRADILLCPTHFDTFGMVLVEGLAFGIPVISLRTYAVPEIITDGKDGFLVDGYANQWYDHNFVKRISSWEKEILPYIKSEERTRIVRELTERISLLIEDSNLRQKMGIEGLNKISEGKFSIRYRKTTLKRIYEESLTSITS